MPHGDGAPQNRPTELMTPTAHDAVGTDRAGELHQKTAACFLNRRRPLRCQGPLPTLAGFSARDAARNLSPDDQRD
jgi:hypothetical protein